MDALLVVNAGSSSLKFQLFAVEGGAPSAATGARSTGSGSGRGSRCEDADGAPLEDRTFEAAALPTCPPRSRRCGHGSPRCRASGLSPSATASCMGGPTSRAPSGSTRRSSRGSRATRTSRRCTSRTTSRRSGSSWRSTPPSRRSPASTRPFIAATPTTPTGMPSRARFMPKACGATASTACPTNTWPTASPPSRPRSRGDA